MEVTGKERFERAELVVVTGKIKLFHGFPSMT